MAIGHVQHVVGGEILKASLVQEAVLPASLIVEFVKELDLESANYAQVPVKSDNKSKTLL